MNRLLLVLSLIAVPAFASASAKTVKGMIVEAVRKAPEIKAAKVTNIYVRNTTLGNRWSNFKITGARTPGHNPAFPGGIAVAPSHLAIKGSYDDLGGKVIVSGIRIAKDGPQPLAAPRR